MPLYEYKCNSCGAVFEAMQKFSDEPLKVHEKCGGELVRLISAPAFQFKGTGWYVTDYARGSNGGSKAGNTHHHASKESGNGSEKTSPPAKSDNTSSTTTSK